LKYLYQNKFCIKYLFLQHKAIVAENIESIYLLTVFWDLRHCRKQPQRWDIQKGSNLQGANIYDIPPGFRKLLNGLFDLVLQVLNERLLFKFGSDREVRVMGHLETLVGSVIPDIVLGR